MHASEARHVLRDCATSGDCPSMFCRLSEPACARAVAGSPSCSQVNYDEQSNLINSPVHLVGPCPMKPVGHPRIVLSLSSRAAILGSENVCTSTGQERRAADPALDEQEIDWRNVPAGFVRGDLHALLA